MSVRTRSIRRAVLVAVLASFLATAGAHAVDSTAARDVDPHERWMVGTINDARQARGLPRLRISSSLTRAASDYAEYMRARDHFDHTDLEGRSPYERAQAAGWPNSFTIGEVIHRGVSTEAIFNGWRTSPPHWQILMSPSVEYIGIGRDPVRRSYWVGVVGSACPAGREANCEDTGDTGDSSIPVAPSDLFLDADQRWIRMSSRSRANVQISIFMGEHGEVVPSGAAIRARTLKPGRRWRHRLPAGRYVVCVSQAASGRYGVEEFCEPLVIPGRLTVRLSRGRPAGRDIAFILRVPEMAVGRPVRVQAAAWARRCVDYIPWVDGPYCWTGWQRFYRRRVAHVKTRHRLLVPRHDKRMKVTVTVPTVRVDGVPYHGVRLIRRYPSR